MSDNELKIKDSLNVIDDYCEQELNKQEIREKDCQTRVRAVVYDNKARMRQNNDRLFKMYNDDIEVRRNMALNTDDIMAQEKYYSDMKNVEGKVEDLCKQENDYYESEEKEAKYEYVDEKKRRIDIEQEFKSFKKKIIALELIKLFGPSLLVLAKKYWPKFLSYFSKKSHS